MSGRLLGGEHKQKLSLEEQAEGQRCYKCGKEITTGDAFHHAVRCGYSSVHFPLFHFERVPMCADCLKRQKKLDVFEKVLALIALAVVLYFMGIGLLYLFSPLI